MAAYYPPQELLDAFAASLAGMTHGDVTILHATAEISQWDEDRVYVELHLTDPPPGKYTWSVDSVRELRMETRRRADEAGIEHDLEIYAPGRDRDDEPELELGYFGPAALQPDDRSEPG